MELSDSDIEQLYKELLYLEGIRSVKLKGDGFNIQSSSSLGEHWHESYWERTDSISLEEFEETLLLHQRKRREKIEKLLINLGVDINVRD